MADVERQMRSHGLNQCSAVPQALPEFLCVMHKIYLQSHLQLFNSLRHLLQFHNLFTSPSLPFQSLFLSLYMSYLGFTGQKDFDMIQHSKRENRREKGTTAARKVIDEIGERQAQEGGGFHPIRKGCVKRGGSLCSSHFSLGFSSSSPHFSCLTTEGSVAHSCPHLISYSSLNVLPDSFISASYFCFLAQPSGSSPVVKVSLQLAFHLALLPVTASSHCRRLPPSRSLRRCDRALQSSMGTLDPSLPPTQGESSPNPRVHLQFAERNSTPG